MQINLKDLMKGSIEEKMKKELARVIENMLDPNTDLKARKISINFSVTPSKNRSSANLDFIIKSTIRPAEKVETIIAIGKTNGEFDAAEIGNELPGQMGLDIETGKVIDGKNVEVPGIRVIGK